MSRAYFDSTYLAKLYCPEHGSDYVLEESGRHETLVSCLHARGEFVSTLHRKLREKTGNRTGMKELLEQFHDDCNAGRILLLPIRDNLFLRIENAFLRAPATMFLRAADALHLACAAEDGFTEVYSNDRHFLAAAPLFGLRGVNVIPE